LNVKYILVHGDWNSKLISWYNPSPELATKILNGSINVTSFGKLDFYEIPDEYFLPRIYPATIPIQINGSIDKMFRYIIFDSYVIGNNVIFLSNQTSGEQWELLDNYNGTISTDRRTTTSIPVYNGLESPFGWDNLSIDSSEARYYEGWKSVVRTDGKESESTMSFRFLKDCPYQFPSFSFKKWQAYNSTLVYIKTGSKPLVLDEIFEGGRPVRDIAGVWWETNWTGMATKRIDFPVTIPENQKAIIQINYPVRYRVVLYSLDMAEWGRLKDNSSAPEITFERVNPTKYQVKVEKAFQPFFLVFGESYNSQWKAYGEDKEIELNEITGSYENLKVKEARHETSFTPEDINYLFVKPLDEKDHFIANGYANAWYIDPRGIDRDGDGNFTITLYFASQSSFYLGCLISLVTFLVCIIYIFVSRLR
jgi:hypothetical protein